MAAGQRILIVDDDAPLRALIGSYLADEGFDIIEAENGADARNALLAEPDLVLLDIMLPDEDGVDILRAFKEEKEPYRYIPVIMITGAGDEDARLRALQAGADEFLVKPVQRESLLARVDSLLKLKTNQDRLLSFREELEREVERRARLLESEISQRLQAERALRQGEMWFRQFFAAAPDALLLLDGTSGRVLDVNPAAVTLFGHSREVLVDSHHTELYPERFRRVAEDIFQRLLDQGRWRDERASREFRALRADGIEIPVEVTSAVTGTGPDRLVVAIVRDISERRQSREQLRRGRETSLILLDALDGEAFLVSADGVILAANKALAERCCMSPRRMVGRALIEVFPTDVAERWSRHIDRAIEAKAAQRGEEWDGDRVLELVVQPVRDSNGRITVLAVHTHDLSVQKAIQAQLDEARKLAEEHADAKSAFVANMSHEIRTPLNVILGMADMALKHDPASLCDSPGVPAAQDRDRDGDESAARRQRRYLLRMREAARSLLGIVNDILDLSKIEADRIELENIPFDLYALIAECRAMFADQAREQGVALEVSIARDVPRWVSGDPVRLRQVLVNLLNNALKFTDQGEVAARVSLGDEDGGNPSGDSVLLHWEVRDTGVGIPEDRLDTVFESFRQADQSVTRRYGGTGLGLAICRNLVVLMGGWIRVLSRENRGTVFHFTTRMGLAEAPQTSKDTTSEGLEASLVRLRVLVVEDNRLNRELLLGFLAAKGHETAAAVNGRHALEILARESFDAVLMDVQMAEMDGVTATRKLRALAAQGQLAVPVDIPVIAITAHAIKGDRERFLEAGMTDYVAKPVDLEGLLVLLQRLTLGRGSTISSSACSGEASASAEGGTGDDEAGDDGQERDDRANRARALDRLGHNEGLLMRLESIYLTDAAAEVGALRERLFAGAVEEASRAAHSLKGSSNAIGANGAGRLAGEVELALRDGEVERARDLLPGLEKEVHRVCGLLRTLVYGDQSA